MTNRYSLLPGALIPWYKENARDLPWRKDKEPYHIWLSEIMLQQTRVEAVREYYFRFLKELPTIEALAEAEEEKLLKLWEGLGYYNRARNLKKAAGKIMEEYNGVFPSEYSEIISLPGIGEYTAGAICSNCFDEPVAAVDGNVLRVVSRIMESFEDILKASVKKDIKARLEAVYPKTGCGDFTQSLMELGATVCLPAGTPKCEMCPAAEFCLAHRNGTWQKLPVKVKKKDRKTEDRTIFILRCKDDIALRKREGKGLLAGMWELPGVSGHQTAKEAVETAQQWGCSPVSLHREVARKHIFSHIEWHMKGFYIECRTKTEAFEWINGETINSQIALPTAFKQFFSGELCKFD